MTKYKIIFDLRIMESWATTIDDMTYNVLLESRSGLEYKPRDRTLQKEFGSTSAPTNQGLAQLVRSIANREHDKNRRYPNKIKVVVTASDF